MILQYQFGYGLFVTGIEVGVTGKVQGYGIFRLRITGQGYRLTGLTDQLVNLEGSRQLIVHNSALHCAGVLGHGVREVFLVPPCSVQGEPLHTALGVEVKGGAVAENNYSILVTASGQLHLPRCGIVECSQDREGGCTGCGGCRDGCGGGVEVQVEVEVEMKVDWRWKWRWKLRWKWYGDEDGCGDGEVVGEGGWNELNAF